MRPQIIGRTLGIGVRVAGRIVGQHLAGTVQSAAGTPRTQSSRVVAEPVVKGLAAGQTAAQITTQAGRSVSRGLGGFLRPFRRVGGIIWLEVTGLFFLIFVPVFAWRGMWPARASYAHGPDHWRFLIFTGLTLVFLYLGVNSFWRARRR